MAYCIGKKKIAEHEVYEKPDVKSRPLSTVSNLTEVGKSEVETVAEVHSPSSPTSEQDFPLERSSSRKTSSHSNIHSVGSSEQTLQENVDEILPVPKEKKRWFRISGKRKENKDKHFKEPKAKPPPKQTKGKLPKNFQQDLQRSSGEALRSYNETMEKILSTKHLSESQIRKLHEDNKQKVLRRYTDEFSRQLHSRNQDIVAMIIEENAKLEKDITALFEQRLKQYQQQGGILAEALELSNSTLNNLSPETVSPTASTASLRTRSDNQSPASSRTSLNEQDTSSLKRSNRWSFIRVGPKKEKPTSSRSSSPALSQAEVESRAEEELQRLNNSVLGKMEEALRNYKISMDAFVSSTQELTEDKIRTAHAASRKAILGRFTEQFNDFFNSRNRSAVTAVQNARFNLESDMNAQLAPYLQKHQEKISRDQAKSIITQAEYFYQKEMMSFKPSLRTEREVKIKHLDAVQASLNYFDILVKDQGWVVPSTWRNEIQIKLDEKLQEILQQLMHQEDTPVEEVSSPAPFGTAANIINNLKKLPEAPVSPRKTKSINVGIYFDSSKTLVGMVNPKNLREPEIIKSLLPNITFKDNGIEIGGPDNSDNSFDICELILADSSTIYPLSLPLSHSLTTEEIITIFFDQLLSEVKALKKVDFVATAVVTVPFVITSLEKERIILTLKAAGVTQVRILSSLITTAIAYTQDINYYANPYEPKLVFATHSLKKSFAMAIVEIKSHSIITKRCTGSQNAKEGLLQTFQNCHRHLYSNGKLKQEQVNFVTKTYSSAAKQLFRESKVDALIEVQDIPGDNVLSRILHTVLREKPQTKLVFQGPLAGACLLAAKGSLPASIIPPSLEVYDASRSDLVLVTNSKVHMEAFKNRDYQPGLLFKKPVAVPPNGLNMIMKEVYFKDKFVQNISQYTLDVKSNAKICGVDLRCLVEQDGVLRIEADMSKDVIEGSLKRLDAVVVSKKPGSRLNRIYAYYYPNILHGFNSEQGSPQKLSYPVEKPFYEDTQTPNGHPNGEIDSHVMQEPTVISSVEIKKDSITSTDSDKVSINFEEKAQVPQVIQQKIPINSQDYSKTETESDSEIDSSSNSSSEPRIPPPKIPTQPTGPSPKIISEAVKEFLEKATKDGIQSHKALMMKLTDSLTPFTDNQIKTFHRDSLFSVISAYNKTTSIISQDPEIAATTVQARETMIKNINLLLNEYISRHEATVSQLKKKIKRWELEGECYYDDEMERFEPRTKLSHQVKSKHTYIKAEVLNAFAGNIRAEGLEWQDFWKAELEWRLESKLEEALEECLKETTPITVTPPTPTIQVPTNPVPAVRATVSEKISVPKEELLQTGKEPVQQRSATETQQGVITKPERQAITAEVPKQQEIKKPEEKHARDEPKMDSKISTEEQKSTKPALKEDPKMKSKEYPQGIPTPILREKLDLVEKTIIREEPKALETTVLNKEPKLATKEMPKEKPDPISKQASTQEPKVAAKEPLTAEPNHMVNETQIIQEAKLLPKPFPVYKPSKFSPNNEVIHKEKVVEGTTPPLQTFKLKTPSSFFKMQTYNDRGPSKPFTTNQGFVPITALEKSPQVEKREVPAPLQKTKIPEAPKIASSAEKKKLSSEGTLSITSAGSTPSPPRKSPLTTVYNFDQDTLSKLGEAAKSQIIKPHGNQTVVTNNTSNKPEGKNIPVTPIQNESNRNTIPAQPPVKVKVTTKILPTNIPSKSFGPPKQTKTSCSSSIDSPKQPSGYTYSYNFRDSSIKPIKSPLSPPAIGGPTSQVPVRTKRSSSSSSDDSRKGKRSLNGNTSSKIPTFTNSRVSPPKTNSSAIRAIPTSSPAKPLASPSLNKVPPAQPTYREVTANSKPALPTKNAKVISRIATPTVINTNNKPNPTVAMVTTVPTASSTLSSRNSDLRSLIIKSSQNPVGKLIPDIDKERLELIQNTLNKATSESTKFHNRTIQAIANKKLPYTQKELEVHHNNHLVAILGAWNQTFGALGDCNIPNLNEVLSNGGSKLKKSINSQLFTNLLHHNTAIDKLSKQVKELTIEADNQYDDFMDEFLPQNKSRGELEAEHSRIKEEVVTIFKERFNELGLEWEDFWMFELEERLEDKLKDLLEECTPELVDTNRRDSEDSIHHIDSSESDQHDSIKEASTFSYPPQYSEQGQPGESWEKAPALSSGHFITSQSVSMPTETITQPQASSVPTTESVDDVDRQSMKVYHSILKKTGAPSPSRRVNFGFPNSSQGDLQERTQSFDGPSHAMSTFHVDNQPVTSRPQKAIRTKSLPDLDSNRAAGQFITSGAKRPAAAPPPLPAKRNERINVGIYLDENFANVGTFLNNDVNEVDLILQIPAEIAFLDDEVVVGWQAEKNRHSLNHFYLYQLIKIKASEVHPVQFKTIKHSPCTEEIIAMFFKKLHQSVLLVRNGSFVGNIIITIPFTATSAEKERIKMAAKIAGLQNVRVLSSLVTMAVAYARESQFYLMDRPQTKTVLVVHYLKHSFSMAVLEVSQSSVTTRSCYGSENMPEGHQVPFLSSHALMFGNGTLNQKQDVYISNIYKKALQQLSSGTPWDRIIIVKEQHTTKLDKVLDNLFGKQNQARGYLDGPLLGACLLACKSQLNIPIIPSNLQVNDASRSHLVLRSATGQVWRKHFRNHVFRPEIVFRFPLSVPPEGTAVVLEEEFAHDVDLTRIGQYQVIARREGNSNCDVILNCAVDEDGVFTLAIDYTQAVLEGYLVRSDQLFVNASDQRNPISGFGKLSEHYQNQRIRATLV